MDWENIFGFQTPLLEIFLRGSITYLALFLLLRLVLRREVGTVSTLDVLVIVIVAESSSNALQGQYHTIPDGLLLATTVILWDYFLNWLGYHVPALQSLLHPPPLELIRDGKMQRRVMRKEYITEDELRSMVREQGIDDFSKVKRAFMEGDGMISVIAYDDHDRHNPPDKQRAG